MFYKFSHGLKETNDIVNDKDELIFGICIDGTMDAWAQMLEFSQETVEEYRNPARIIHKMDSYYGYDFGLLHVLKRKGHTFVKTKIGLYIKPNMVLVVCDDMRLEKELYDAADKINEKTFCLEHIVTGIINCVLFGNLKMIEEMENELATIDEEILNNETENFNKKTRHIRDDLLYLTHYYEQLIDVCEELLQDENSFFKEQEIHHIRILADRINRLDGNVHMLKDYLVQIRDSCQSQMNANMNHIMYIFTVVTTIFLPLTLIVGWYGMNFKHMPELTWQFGYLGVALLSIAIVIVCLWFFRKKKLFK